MLEVLGTVFGAIFSGGATGLIGVLIQRFADYKNKQLDMSLEKQRGEYKLLEKDKDREIMQAEWAGRERVSVVEGDTARDVADAQAFAKSYDMEPKKFSGDSLSTGQQWLMVILDFFRGGVRPLLTVYLCILTSYMYWEVRGILGTQKLDPDQALEVWRLIISTILYLTTTVVLWWFGTRNKQAQPGRSPT